MDAIKTCGYGTRYNSRIKQCDFMHKVNCTENAILAQSSGGSRGGRGMPGSPSNAPQVLPTITPRTNSSSTKCPRGFTGVKPHPDDCKKFIECVSGKEEVILTQISFNGKQQNNLMINV